MIPKRNHKRDIFIAFLSGTALAGALMFEGTHGPGISTLIGLGFAATAWLSFWSSDRPLKQPLSGILTFVRQFVEQITTGLLLAFSMMLTSIVPAGLLYWVLNHFWGDKIGLYGMLAGFVIGLPFALRFMRFITERYLAERLATPDLERWKKNSDKKRREFVAGKNLVYPFILLSTGVICLSLFHFIYPDSPDGEVYVFLPIGIFLTLIGAISLLMPVLVKGRFFIHRDQPWDVKVSFVLCLLLTIIFTFLLTWYVPGYGLARAFQ